MGLLVYQGNLSDFTSKERYLKFKEKFLMQDVRFDPSEENSEYLQINEITVYNHSYGDDDSYDTYNYNNDYFVPSIKKMVEGWKRKYSSKVRTLYTSDDKIGFSNEVKNTFRKAFNTICSAKYLSPAQIIFLKKQIFYFEEIIVDYVKDPLPELKSKIEFNWNKHTLVYFFDLLRKNNIITEMKDSDLGRVIDDRFLFKDGDNYSIPKDSRKLLHALGDKGTKSSEISYNLLKELFSNPDFYNV